MKTKLTDGAVRKYSLVYVLVTCDLKCVTKKILQSKINYKNFFHYGALQQF